MSKFPVLVRRAGVLAIALLGGCGPNVPDEELGRVVFEVPEIPPGYEPYELPDLTTPADDASSEALSEASNGPKADTAPSSAETVPDR